MRLSLATSRAIDRHNGRLPADAPTLTFYPRRPQPRAQIVGMLATLGIRIGHDLASRGAQIAWDTRTWLAEPDLRSLAHNAINRACRDTSKSRVDALWADIAGYSLSVNPLVTAGPLVVKSEKNAAHDGRVVIGPLRRLRPGVVYQRFVDGTVGNIFLQTRPALVGGRMPVVLEIHMPIPHWHADAVLELVRGPADLYSPTEADQILAFAAAIGLEYGELDVLRDTQSGRLYVVDANPTPVRPHFLAPGDEALATRLMADAFADEFADRLGSLGAA
jgi:hypothetical protein